MNRIQSVLAGRSGLAGSVLVLVLALAWAGPAVGGPPNGGVAVDLWSDPAAGSIVSPGVRAHLFCRTNTDCYLTLFAVDTEGRVRILFPGAHEDGWVRGGRTLELPSRHAGYDLVFTGPAGLEYVYALATLDPVSNRYPAWFSEGRVFSPDLYEDDDPEDVYLTGWVVGDPFYSIRAFCRDLVFDPDRVDRYHTAYLSFQVGQHVSYPRYLCSDCHGNVWVDPYGPPCSAVRVRLGAVRCSGIIDFRVVFVPRYHYEVWNRWRPRGCGDRDWHGPDGRWVWSSKDGRRLRQEFADARGAWIDSGHQNGKESGRSGRLERPDRSQPDRNGWTRAHEERLESAVQRPNAPAPNPGGGNGTKPEGVERSGRQDREPQMRAERTKAASPERAPRIEASRGRASREKARVEPDRSDAKRDAGETRGKRAR